MCQTRVVELMVSLQPSDIYGCDMGRTQRKTLKDALR